MVLRLRKLKSLLARWLSQAMVVHASLDTIFGMAEESTIKSFVQIGANDGIKNDPLYHRILKFEWKGILVEPDSVNFKKLKENYSHLEGLIFENIGIAPENGEMLFYKIKNITDQEPGWYDQVGSFDKNTFLKNISYGKGLEHRIISEPLPVIAFDELLEKNHFGTPDLLHLDTEGFDYRILRSIDLGKYPIRMILFESEWMTKPELKEIIRWLRSHHYLVVRNGIDYAGVKKI